MASSLPSRLALLFDSDGRTVVGGSACYHVEETRCGAGFARFLPDGTLDPGFGGVDWTTAALTTRGRGDGAVRWLP